MDPEYDAYLRPFVDAAVTRVERDQTIKNTLTPYRRGVENHKRAELWPTYRDAARQRVIGDAVEACTRCDDRGMVGVTAAGDVVASNSLDSVKDQKCAHPAPIDHKGHQTRTPEGARR